MGGNKACAISLMARITALKSANDLKDIINFPPFHFHKLKNNGKGKNLWWYFAIDVKSRKDKWRIILEPLDENEMKFNPCFIDKIANIVKVIEIKEVSEHYE